MPLSILKNKNENNKNLQYILNAIRLDVNNDIFLDYLRNYGIKNTKYINNKYNEFNTIKNNLSYTNFIWQEVKYYLGLRNIYSDFANKIKLSIKTDSTIKNKAKDDDVKIYELFKDGDLIARALFTDLKLTDNLDIVNITSFDEEMNFLRQRKEDGIYKNVERHGYRNRSATVLVPEMEMKLFRQVGFLYDGNKSTIRGYMLRDRITCSQFQHNNFYNIQKDKNKFESVISRKTFTELYKNSRSSSDKASYNEVLGNFFPESITGLVIDNDSIKSKLILLTLKHHMKKKYNLDLPLVIMQDKGIKVWKPKKEEIINIINQIPHIVNSILINEINESEREKKSTKDNSFFMKVCINTAKSMGYLVTFDRADNSVLTLEDIKEDILPDTKSAMKEKYGHHQVNLIMKRAEAIWMSYFR